MKHYKKEFGNRYGDFIVTNYTDERVSSNGCVKWLCRCVHCGAKRLINGNALRFGKIKHCQECNSKKR